MDSVKRYSANVGLFVVLVVFRPIVEYQIREFPASSQQGLTLTETLLYDGQELWFYSIGRCLPDADAVDTRELGVLVFVDGDDL